MPSSRTEVAATEVGGKIYVIGGFGQGGDLVEEYDPAKDSWRRRASLPRPLHHVGAAAVAGKIYVFGGESTSGTFNQNESYDPATDRWSTWAPMPTARHGLGAVVVGKSIYVLSGGPKPGGTYSSANELFRP